jgi:hypothetical protein
MSPLPLLRARDLRRLAAERHGSDRCPACGGLQCKGWEALPGGFDAAVLERVGTLRDPQVEDPTVEEYHPAGTDTWSPEAPIAPAFHPFNKSDAWRCTSCHRLFVRYTEYGGYYQEERIREVGPALVVGS